MAKRHYRISLADALSAHERALSLGGLPGISNLALIESAIARPYSGYYRRIEHKAAALVESVARNHGFADGNKRTTLILLQTLLSRSGYRLSPLDRSESRNDAVESMILAVASGAMQFDALVAWFAPRIRRSR